MRIVKRINIFFFLFIITTHLFSLPSLCLHLSAFFPVHPYLKNQPVPRWWEIRILLIADGNYKVNDANSSYLGRYSFTLLWTGSMEINDDDFILYYENSELISFDAEEKRILPESTLTISTKDFRDKPFLDSIYILRKGEDLQFYFFVKGFLIPQNKSDRKFYLNLPSSEEKPKIPSEIIYNSFITKGSNLIFLEEKQIYIDSVEKKLSWEWNYQKWQTIQNTPVFFSNGHNVKFQFSIKPHF
jgi:hypothetical protein